MAHFLFAFLWQKRPRAVLATIGDRPPASGRRRRWAALQPSSSAEAVGAAIHQARSVTSSRNEQLSYNGKD